MRTPADHSPSAPGTEAAGGATATAPALGGVGYALAAFGLWGLFPLYFKAVASVPATEVLAHRIVWSIVWVGILLLVLRQWRIVARMLTDGRTRRWLALSALLIASNWLIFIWAIAHDRVLQASLGYFITPLVNVLFGRLFLGEQLRRVQWLAVGLAGLGVSWMLLGVGVIPWVSLGLAATFSSYGLVRKIADVEAIPALFVEALLVCAPALIYLLWLGAHGQGRFGTTDIGFDLLLVAAGLVTAIPLILYGQAMRRLRLASIGLFQYIVPTMQMLLAVFVFGEVFTPQHGVTFGCIWLGLALYSRSAWRQRSRVIGGFR